MRKSTDLSAFYAYLERCDWRRGETRDFFAQRCFEEAHFGGPVGVVDLDDEDGAVYFDGLHVRGDCLADEFGPRAEHSAHAGCVVRAERCKQARELALQGGARGQVVAAGIGGHGLGVVTVCSLLVGRTRVDSAALYS